MAHANVDLVRKGFEAFATGDVAVMDQLMADDAVFVFHVAGGKVTETWFAPMDHTVVEEFWA